MIKMKKMMIVMMIVSIDDEKEDAVG